MANPTILFVCPHGGGKSAIAASYMLEKLAEKGLAFTTDFAAGADPYTEMPKPILKYLGSRGGRDLSKHIPRRVNADDLSNAAHVVSIGCHLDERFELDAKKVQNWNVPDLSDGFDVAVASILNQVDAFVESLSPDDE